MTNRTGSALSPPLAALFAIALLAAPQTCGAVARTDAPVPPALFQELRWRQLGPYRAGWATIAAGVPGSPRTFYFGGAGGGVWRTDDAGVTWQPRMQNERSSAIGALAVAPSDPLVLYAGTGQEGSRYDLAPGDGVYRSEDGGETWTHAGLGASRHIGALLVDPRNARRVLAAAIGSAFGPGGERGVYLTTDGGNQWQPVLSCGDSVGAVDLASDPTEPDIVFASTWQRRMRPWLDYFVPQEGPLSRIWRSTDAGAHWTQLAGGLPGGSLSRIGLAVARGTGGRVVYASLASGGAPRSARGPGSGPGPSGLYRSSDRGEHWLQVNSDGSLSNHYFGRLIVAPDDSNTVYCTGQSLRRSTDGGRHFEVFRGSPGGDDYHHLWIDPTNPKSMIAASDQGAAVSVNGGRTWSSWYNQPTGQFYHLGADDRFPYHVYSGQQDNGTVEIASRGPYGAIEEREWHPVGGDERDDMIPVPGSERLVMGSGLGGGVSRFDEVTRQSLNVSPWPIGSYAARPTSVRYRYGWITPLSISAAAPHAMYLGAQLLFRSLDRGDHWDVVSPDLTGAKPGAGPCEDPDPAAARECGFGVISAIAPSPLAADRIWVGTDDGLIQLTTDGGVQWRNVTPPELPAWGIVFSIDASPFDTSVAYAAVDLHRIDRHEPLLLRTSDSGRHWQRITNGIPGDEFTSVVRTDPGRPGLLYAGTRRAVYVSFDDGEQWQPLSRGLPTTWMRDLLPHHGDLLLATQGRGLWVLDDVAPLREVTPALAGEAAHLFAPAAAFRLRGSESHDTPWPPETPLGENPPAGALIDYWLGGTSGSPVSLTITDSSGAIVRRFSSQDAPESLGVQPYFEQAWVGTTRVLSAGQGMHRFIWNLRYPRPDAPGYGFSIAAVRREGTPVHPLGTLVLPGRYTVTLSAAGRTRSCPLEVRLDPRVETTPEALRAQFALAQAAVATLKQAMAASREIARSRPAPAGLPASALADSLAGIAHANDEGLLPASRTLAQLLTALEAADAAPPQGMIDAITDCTRRIDGVIGRWRRLESALPGALKRP